MIALGRCAACLFFNDEELADKVRKAGLEVFEEAWKMPILPWHRDCVKGKVADLSNLGNEKLSNFI